MGAGVNAGDQILKPWVAKVGAYHTAFISHDGASRFTIGRCKDGRLDKAGPTLANPAVLANGGSPNLPVRIGGIHENTKAGRITFEEVDIYNRALDQTEIIKAHNALYALAQTRGRS
ncbi:hypothetical protein HB780_20885 [Rhizobium lusitanum]|uniref:hypothetical protein n=1 Tax=Rhizobium lusitanum TaxID=293958 RepID=UPI00160CF065|nr:hypothetical protein [Rhizobium lusitanum]QND48097.1 hypothetical protein HB780_20885 [Rhizobium lusitanum]